MTLARARIIRASDSTLRELTPMAAQSPRRTVVRRELLEAEAQARAMIENAAREVEALRQEAGASNAAARATAIEEGHREGLARAAHEVTRSLALEQRHNVSETERVVGLATVLAERIVGRALELDPSVRRDMALALLSEVRGARRITFRCHPSGVHELESSLAEFRAHAEIVVQGAPGLGPGDFELATDVGTLKGTLGSRLELLAQRLRQGLQA